LETPRLWLRLLELADAEQAQPLFAQWEVVRYLTNQVAWPFPPDGGAGRRVALDTAPEERERPGAEFSDQDKLTQGLRQHRIVDLREPIRPQCHKLIVAKG
jgi:hypothetical protein